MPIAGREYKDRLFAFVFGREENKGWTLSLYNAVNGSNYSDPNMISINTIRKVIYLGMRNNVSFLIADEMSLYEQQSTCNPNMPLRLMQYLGNLYEKHVKERKLNKYGTSLLSLPAPRLVVFYNVKTDKEDETILRLSDSFPEGSRYDVEVNVRMLNVNYGKNAALLEACEPLREYAWLVRRVREGAKSQELEGIINAAITDMPEDWLLKAFLEAHRAEVMGMLLTEYDEAEAMELFRRDGEKLGEARGLEQGEDRAFALVQKLLSLDRADDALRAASDEAYRNRLFEELGIA